MKKFLLILSLFTISLNAQVVINEYSAANYDETDFLSGFGTNYSDWIELYNSSSTAVDLSGYHLSDKFSNVQKWQIPAGASIPGNGYLVFLADKEDGFSSGYYHTNFKLTQTSGNEALVFSDPAGTIIDSISLNYPNKKNDSRCRMTDGSAIWGISKNPTDGSSNNNSKEKYADIVLFNIPAGFYTVGATLSVELSTTELSSSIRYTTDGSKPNSSSTLYVNPISLMNTSVIRAKTYSTDPNISSSHIETNTYFVNETHTTKVISISGGSGLTNLLGGSFSEPQGTFELFETDGTFLTESTGEFNKHGNDSWAYDQRGLDYVSRDQFGNNYALEDEIFDTKDRDKFQRVILKCGASDNYPFENGGAHIRDSYINEMSQLGDLRLDERSNEFAVIYVNGDYWGVYDIREKTDDHDFTNYYYDQDRNNLQYLKTWGGTWSEYGGAQAQTDWDNLVNFITTNDMTNATNYNYVDSLFNTGSIIDYFVLNSYVVTSDWLNWNTGWWRGLDPDGDKKKWRYTLWDMDATFGHYINYTGIPDQSANADPCDPEILGDVGGQGHVPIWNALQTNEQFFADYINRYAELSSTVFSCDSMHNLLNIMVAEIEPEMPAHIARWGGSMGEWQTNVAAIHTFIDTRCANVTTQLVDCNPELSGPYNLNIIVEPAGAGEVQLSSILPSYYPFDATYFGGINISLDADEFPCWSFDHWTLANGNTITPDMTTEEIILTLTSDDTITVYFTPVICDVSDTVYINVQPPGSGTINIDGVNFSSFPSTQYVSDSTNHLFDAIANTGYTFNNWDWNIHSPSPNSTSTNTIVYTYSNDTLTVNFDPILMDTIVYIVQPLGAGTITVDGTSISSFPNMSFYPDGSNSNLSAIPNTGYTFNNWQFNNNTPLPNTTSSNISTTWISNDTVYININATVNFDITYLTNPIGSGNIDIDGVNTTSFPTTITYPDGTNVNLTANANSGNVFDFWQSENSTFVPNISTNSVNFNVVADDTIIANFNDLPIVSKDLWIITNPSGVATLMVDNDVITSSPFMGTYNIGQLIEIKAYPNSANNFNQWHLSGAAADYNQFSSFIFLGEDTLHAYFNDVLLGLGDIGEDFISIDIFPTIVENELTIEILAKEKSNISIDLLNISGQKIQSLYKGDITNSLHEIFQIDDISQGLYFIRVQTSKTNLIYKIVKM